MGIVWKIVPERATVPAKSSMVFTLHGLSEYEGEMQETLVCKNTAGNAKEITGEVMIIHASASVTVPLLDFSTDTMGFDYSHDPDVPLSLQTRPLTMRNVSRVPLEFSIASQPPFSVDREDWILEPDEAGTVSVTFDPDYRDDAVSHEVRSKLLIAYADNPPRRRRRDGRGYSIPEPRRVRRGGQLRIGSQRHHEARTHHHSKLRARPRSIRVGLRRVRRRDGTRRRGFLRIERFARFEAFAKAPQERGSG